MDLRDHLDARLDRIEGKLDSHLDRISKSEEAIVWLKGHVRLATVIGLAALGALAGAFFGL
jgi:hypothetical protein